jgi:F1F0 ATPase subunit 2
MLVGMAMDAHAMTQVFTTQGFATGEGALALLAASTAWLAAGGAVGAFHFLTLRTSVRMLATGSPLPAALALHLTRFAVTAVALSVIARHGVLPLLAATIGVLVARAAVLRITSP